MKKLSLINNHKNTLDGKHNFTEIILIAVVHLLKHVTELITKISKQARELKKN